jgi:hypothetical protein
MKTFDLKACVVVAFLGWSAISFSQLGAPEPDRPLAAGPDPAAASPLAEGYFVVNGITYFTRQGQAFRMEREVSLKVTPNGIFGFDGKPLNLARGLMLTPDGRHAPIPTGINLENLPGHGGDPREASRPSSGGGL